MLTKNAVYMGVCFSRASSLDIPEKLYIYRYRYTVSITLANDSLLKKYRIRSMIHWMLKLVYKKLAFPWEGEGS